MCEVFVSYAREDSDAVDQIVTSIKADGIDAFYDKDLGSVANYDLELRKKLRSARALVVFWSERSINSENVLHEANIAKRDNKLIPVVLSPLDIRELPMGHSLSQCIVVPDKGMNHEIYEQLISAIAEKTFQSWQNTYVTLKINQVKRESRLKLAELGARLKEEQERADEMEALLDSAQSTISRVRSYLGKSKNDKITQLVQELLEMLSATPRR
jgi:hypothetical protein